MHKAFILFSSRTANLLINIYISVLYLISFYALQIKHIDIIYVVINIFIFVYYFILCGGK